MQQCGFCSMVSGLIRRAMCIGSRRGSSDSYYRELGEQETLKIEDRNSDVSDNSSDIRSQDDRIASELLSLYDEHNQRKVCTGRFLTMHKRRRKRLITRSLCSELGLLDDLHIGQVQCILDQSCKWKFNAFTLDNVSGGRCLPFLCIHLFHFYGLLSYFNLDVSRAWKLFSLIEEGYHSTNPYHNTVHAVDVTQAMHCFLQQDKIRKFMEPLEIMASLIAAIAHDVDHPGVNQPFLIATSNHLASLYKNNSVLENHHWRAAISCLIESGLVSHIDGLFALLERQISSLILATDITRQQEYLGQFKNHLDKGTLDMRIKEHRHLVLQIALKCADISNPCRSWDISRKWSLIVCEEFFRQGDYERKLNLPVTALCDRHTTSIPKIQTGFFKYVVTPLITEWNRFLMNDLSTQMLKNLAFNKNKWETYLAEELAEETRTEISDTELIDEDDIESCSGTNISESSENLLPLRRSSLNPASKYSFKEQLRRFSAPLNLFQESKNRNKEKGQTVSIRDNRPIIKRDSTDSELSLNLKLSMGDQSERRYQLDDKVLSTEHLLPDLSIASITTPVQATRLNSVIKESCAKKLVRQHTFPPMESQSSEASLAARPLYSSNEDDIYPQRHSKTEAGQIVDMHKESTFYNMFKIRTDKTENEDAPNIVVNESPSSLEKENLNPLTSLSNINAKESTSSCSQLRDNLTSQHVILTNEIFSGRKSVSVEAPQLSAVPKDLYLDSSSALPLFLRRTLSSKESWSRRRGSAPAPVESSDLGRLVSTYKRKPAPASNCQHWLIPHVMPRRSSLPVEVLTGAPSYRNGKAIGDFLNPKLQRPNAQDNTYIRVTRNH